MIRKLSSDSVAKEETGVSPAPSISNKFLSNQLENAPKILFYIFALLLPVWFIPVNIGVEFSREISFSAITVIALILWLLQILSEGEIYFKNSVVYLGIAAFLFISFISAFFSASPLYSIFFSDTTPEKVSTFLLGAVIMFLVGGAVRDQVYGIKALFILIFASALSGLYSLLSFFNIARLPLEFTKSIDFNVIGTANGLALFYSSILLMCLASLIMEREKISLFPKNINLAFLITSLIFIFNLIVINYQFAWVVILFGSVFLLGLKFTLDQPGRLTLNKRTVLMLAVIVFSILMIMIRTPFFKSVALPIEVSPSASATINISKAVMKEGVKSLLLGSGPATFNTDFGRYKDQSINTTPFWALRFTQGFSYILTILATNGILGFLAFISFIGLLLFTFLKFILEKRNENLFTIPIFIGILTTIMTLIVYRANFSLILLLFFLSGLFFVVSGAPGKKIEFKTPWLSFTSSMAILFLISLSVFFGYFIEERARAAIHFRKGASLLSQGNFSLALSQLEKATSINSYNDNYFRALAQTRLAEIQNIINRAASSKDADLQIEFQNQVSSAISAAQRAVQLNQLDSQNWRVLASVYEKVIPFIQGSERFAFDAYNKAAEYDPKNPSIYTSLGRTALIFADRLGFLANQSGQSKENIQALKQAQKTVYEEAISAFSKAVELKPDFTDAHFLLAQTHIRQGNMPEAIRRVEASKILSPFDIGIAFQLGVLYYQNNQLNNAELEFLRAVSLNSNYSNAHYFLGLIYSREKNKSKAIEEFEKVRAFNPDNQEVLKILSNLKAGRSAMEGVNSPTP